MKKSEAIRFLDSLKSEDNISIISHKDVDGICSAALLIKFLTLKKIQFHDLQIEEISMKDFEVRGDTLIFLDLTLEVLEKIIEKNKDKKILVIDHHPFKKIPENIVFYNPRLRDKHAYIPASYLVFELCKEIERDIKKYGWIAAVGVIGDKGDENNEVCREFVNSFDNISLLRRISEIISAIEILHKKKEVIEVTEILSEVETPSEFIMRLGKLAYAEKELEGIVKELEKKVEIEGKIVFADATSKYRVTSLIASRLAERFRDKVIIAYSKKENGTYRISGRSNNLLNIGELFEKVCKELKESRGGGHEQAAGAEVKEEEFEEFKEKVKEAVKKILR